MAAFVTWFIRLKGRPALAGLPLAYFISIMLIHWPGAAIYLLDNYRNYDPDIVLDGFRATTYGMIAFCIGVIFAGLWVGKPKLKSYQNQNNTSHFDKVMIEKIAVLLFLLGIVVELFILPLIQGIATVTSIIAGFSQLTVLGVCIGIWNALQHRNKKSLYKWLILAYLFPFLSLINNAFLGFGVNKLIIALAFLYQLRRVRITHIILFSAFSYIAISFFVTYINSRSELRELAWNEGAGYTQKFNKIWDMVTDVELFDLNNKSHLYAIDQRLNQNYLVGESIKYIGSGRIDYANGETILSSLVALVPRVVWPEKPVVGGGGDIVSKYTGIWFSKNTSVGTGQVFEFYINFGNIGVIIGLFIFGFLISYFNQNAIKAIGTGNFKGFILWFLPGISMIQAGGNLVEITTSVGASIGSALLVIILYRRYLTRKSVFRNYRFS